MMKYPGPPKDQYRQIKRRYVIALILGIVILSAGVLVVLGESTVFEDVVRSQRVRHYG